MWRRLSSILTPGSTSHSSETGPSRSSSRTLKENNHLNGSNHYAESRPSGEMPADRRNPAGSHSRQQSDLHLSHESAPSSTFSSIGRRKKSEDKLKKSHDNKINSHEIWMEGGRKDKERDKETKDKDSGSRKPAKETVKSLLKDKESLTSQIQDLRIQLQGVEERDRITQTRCRALENEVQTFKRKSAQDDDEIQSLITTSTHAAEAAAKHIQDLDQKNQGLEDQLRRMRERVQRAEAAAAAAQQAAANSASAVAFDVQRPSPTESNRASQVFHSKADSYAGAEIIRMVETLNAEVLQCAAFVAEAVMAADINLKEEDRVVEKCRKRAVDRVGQRLVEAMKHNAESGAKDPFPLQLALQHTILTWSCYIVQSFTPENQDLNRHLTNIWGRVSNNEDAAVAGKWRAIMAAQLKGPSTSYRAMFDDFRYMMVSAGWSTKATNSATLAANIQARLMTLESSILKLKEAVIEGITSTEMVPSMWVAGQPYHPAEMDSAYPDPTDPEFVNRPIVCSTDLGVQRLAVTRTKDGSLSRKFDTLLKPKVILPSALDDEAL
ncbi:hypothetical protein H1R20_g4796, partial [Candolleomyces eurysporus]